MLGSKYENSVLHRLKGCVRAGMRPATAIQESFWSGLVVTVDPAVGRGSKGLTCSGNFALLYIAKLCRKGGGDLEQIKFLLGALAC
jgi:hypothetical protein